MQKGKLAIISGPSAGVGKDTLLKLFLDKHPDWHQPPSTTTRQPREGELAGKDMNFVSHEEFEKWQKEDKFLETDFHAGNWYGTLRQPVEEFLSSGLSVILRIDVNGALIVKKKMPEAILIFIAAENPEALEARIRGRGTEDQQHIKERLELAQKEMMLADKFDKVIINATGKQADALAEIEATLLN
jgi:guanylate kinase